MRLCTAHIRPSVRPPAIYPVIPFSSPQGGSPPWARGEMRIALHRITSHRIALPRVALEVNQINDQIIAVKIVIEDGIIFTRLESSTTSQRWFLDCSVDLTCLLS